MVERRIKPYQEQLAEDQRRKLRPLVGMMDQAASGAAAVDGHVERVDDEFVAQVVGD